MRISLLVLAGLVTASLAGCAYVPTDPTVTALSEGVAITVSGSAGSVRRYTFVVPLDAPGLVVQLSGGSGDANLFIRHGAIPTEVAFTCASTEEGNEERCELTNPVAGTWHIAVVGLDRYADLELLADIVTPPPAAQSHAPQE